MSVMLKNVCHAKKGVVKKNRFKFCVTPKGLRINCVSQINLNCVKALYKYLVVVLVARLRSMHDI